MSAKMIIIGGIEMSLREDIEDLQADKDTTATVTMLSWYKEERGGQDLNLEITTLKLIEMVGDCTQEKDKTSLIVVEWEDLFQIAIAVNKDLIDLIENIKRQLLITIWVQTLLEIIIGTEEFHKKDTDQQFQLLKLENLMSLQDLLL